MHVGKTQGNCHELKIHGEKTHHNDSTKYLGDIIHMSGKVTQNISNRHLKAVASLSIIQAILQYVPVRKNRTEIGLELRQSMFIHSVLFNSEIWHGPKDADIHN